MATRLSALKKQSEKYKINKSNGICTSCKKRKSRTIRTNIKKESDEYYKRFENAN